MNAPAPEPILLAPAVEALWENAKSLVQEIPAVRDEIISLWDESALLLDRGSDGDPGHAQRKALFATIAGLQKDFMDHAAEMLKLPSEIAARNRAVDAANKRKEFETALQAMNPAARDAFFDQEVKDQVDLDARVIDAYIIKTDLDEASVLIAAAAPFLAARQIFAAYLNKPSKGATALEFTLALAKNIAVDVVAKGNPVVGPALALAETIKAHTERREKELDAGVNEMDRLFSLEDALRENLEAVRQAEEGIRVYRQSARQIDQDIALTFRQALGILHLLAKAPGAKS